MAYPYKPIEEEKDPNLRRVRRGFQVVPNAPPSAEVTKPNVRMTPTQIRDTQIQAGMIQPPPTEELPTGQFLAAGNRVMQVTPTGTATNFPTSRDFPGRMPTSRDLVNQSVQRTLTARSAGAALTVPSGSPYLTAHENAVAERQKWTSDQLMGNRDPSQYRIEMEDHGFGPAPVLKKRTSEEQVQYWSEINFLTQAAVTKPGGKAAVTAPEGELAVAPQVNIFADQRHIDTGFYTMDKKSIPNAVWSAYKRQTDAAGRKLRLALSARVDNFNSLEEAQDFITALGFDDRVGEFIERRMTAHLRDTIPILYKEFIDKKKIQKADDASYIEWFKHYSDEPGIADLSDEDILADRTPELQNAFERDPYSVRHGIDPATGNVMKLPPRKLTPEEEAQEKFKQEQAEFDLKTKRVDDIVAQSAGKMMKTVTPEGEPIAVTLEKYEKDRRAEARREAADVRKEAAEVREEAASALAFEKEQRLAVEQPKATRIGRLEKLEFMITGRIDKRTEEAKETGIAAGNKAAQIRDYKALAKVQKELEPLYESKPEVAAPVEVPVVKPTVAFEEELPVLTPEQAATAEPEPILVNEQTGQELVVRNGQWVPRQVEPVPAAVQTPAPAEVAPVIEPTEPTEAKVTSPVTPLTRQELEAEAQTMSFDDIDSLKYIAEGVKKRGWYKGVKAVTDIAATIGKTILEANAEIVKWPLTVTAWQAKLGMSEWKKIKVAADDAMREEWVKKRLEEQGK